MGSWVYVKQVQAAHDKIMAAISIETIGTHLDAPNSQHYLVGFGLLYPSRGDFVAFVGNMASRSLVRDLVRSFRSNVAFHSEGSAAPGWLTGVGWSDHWSFWQEGYPAVMVTDTALFWNTN
jgi:hypothetical protein